MTDDVTLTIDGRPVTVPAGTLLIRAAEQIGVEIPRFCDHPLLAPAGACRQCLVEITDAGNGRGFPKPQASCTIPVAEGMVVQTQVTSAVADKAQQGIMEFLLVNHPLDCPVCDKGGECPLQNQAMSNGRGETRFEGVKRTFPKPINLSPMVLLDRERCIVCQRCTRFADEIAGDPSISLVERGAQQQIGVAPGATFDSYFSGNTIQICPVGALTSEQYRFRSRPFDLVSTPSVAEHDACGAAIRVDHRRGTVMRRLSGEDPAVNEEWITDKDRFAFRYGVAPDRLTMPLVRDGGDDGQEQRAASWLEAFAVAAARLRAAGPVAVLTGGRLTVEDAEAYAAFADLLGTRDVDFRARPLSAEETVFLRERVRGHRGVEYADLESAPVVVLAGLEPEDEAGTIFLRLRKGVRAGRTRVVTVAPYLSRGSRKLAAELVACVPGEEAAALAALELPEGAVVLAGERLALSPGALDAAADAAERAGGRWAWVPRRAGDRGAVEAGLLPGPEGRDADRVVAAVLAGELRGLVVGGVDPDDTADPAAFRAALAAAEVVVSLEQRPTDVTRAADVVLPVATAHEKAGTYLTWEGRPRPFPQVFDRPNTMSDARVLRHVGEEYAGLPAAVAGSGLDTPTEQAGHGLDTPGLAGARPGYPTSEDARWSSSPRERSESWAYRDHPDADRAGHEVALATWRLLLDDATLQAGDKHLAATARPAVARVSPATYAALSGSGAGLDGDPPQAVVVTGDRGSLTLPVEVVRSMVDDVVWVPTRSTGRGVWADLASPGSRVRLAPAGGEV